MPAPINVTLRGYLDFFGLKNGGMNPQQPSTFLQPVMELQRWYLESRAIDYNWSNLFVANANANNIAITATSPTNLSNGVDVLVPQSEIWAVLPGSRIFGLFDAVAAQLFLGAEYITQGPNNIVMESLPMYPWRGGTASNATIRLAGQSAVSQVYWLQPGYSLRVKHYGVITGGANEVLMDGTLRIVKLKI
jgi:hypothetical protein